MSLCTAQFGAWKWRCGGVLVLVRPCAPHNSLDVLSGPCAPHNLAYHIRAVAGFRSWFVPVRHTIYGNDSLVRTAATKLVFH